MKWLLLFLCFPVLAQEAYPSRPVRLIVSFTPGGGADLTARVVGQKAEAGIDEEVLASTYFAFALPAGTPRAIVERLHAEMKSALSAPEVAGRLNKAGLEPTGGAPQELADTVRRDIPRFRKIIQDVGIQPE